MGENAHKSSSPKGTGKNNDKSKSANHGGPRPGGGRPKGSKDKKKRRSRLILPELDQLLIPHLPAAKARLVKNLQSRSDAVAQRALEFIFERLYGKAPQVVTGAGGGPIQIADLAKLATLSDEELVFLERIVSKILDSTPAAS